MEERRPRGTPLYCRHHYCSRVMLKAHTCGYLQLLILTAVLSACVSSCTPDDVTIDHPILPGANASSAELINTACVDPVREYRHTDDGSSLCGTLLSKTTGAPVSETIILLMRGRGIGEEAPMVISGANPEAGDLSSVSAADGRFLFENVPPGTYYLAVWAPYDWLMVADLDGDRLPRRIVAEAGASLDLGVVGLHWP